MTITISHPGGTTPIEPGGAPNWTVTPIGGSGDYLVIWSGSHVQRYDASGQKVGDTIILDPQATLGSFTATAAADGGFILYHSEDMSGDVSIYQRHYSAAGVLLADQTKVNPTVNGSYSLVNAITLADGDHVVGWLIGTTYHLQVVSGAGAPIGGDIMPDGSNANTLKLTPLAGGGFLAIWSAHHAGDFQQNIYAQRYDNAGAPVGGQIAVTTGTPNKQLPNATVLSDGSIVMAWAVLDYPSPSGIWAQKYTAAGVASGAAFQVNTTSFTGASGANSPVITALDNGGFAVAWGVPTGGGTAYGLYSQAFTAAGVKSGAEMSLGASGAHFQLAELGGGGYALIWEGGSGQLQSTAILPTTVTPVLSAGVDLANGDGANDTFQAAPTTLNSGDKLDGGAGNDIVQQTVTGTLNFTGVTLTSVEGVTGTSGNDTVIFPKAPPAGLTLNSGGGSDTLVVTGAVNLSSFTLAGNWTVKTTDGGSAVFSVTSLAQLAMIDGRNANVTVDIGSLDLTQDQVLAAFAQGIDELRLPDGVTITRHGMTQLLDAEATAQNGPMQGVGQTSYALPDGGYITFYVAQNSSWSRDFYVQRYDLDGQYVGDLVKILTPGGNDTTASSLLVMANGDYMVFWTTYTGGAGYDQHAQRFNSAYQKVGGEIALGNMSSDPGGSYVVALADGGFLLSHALVSGGVYQSPIGRYNAQGQLVSSTGGHGGAIALLTDGSFVEAWKAQSGPNYTLAFQHYSAAGAAIGGVVNLPGADAATTRPAVAALAGGGFAITWAENWAGDTAGSVYVQSFTAAGAASGPVVVANPNTLGQSAAVPVIFAMTDGGFVIDWSQTVNVNGQQTSVAWQQRFDAAGHRIGNEAHIPGLTEAILTDGSQLFNLSSLAQYTQVTTTLQQFDLAFDFHYLAETGEVVFGSPSDTLVLAPADKVGQAASLLGGGGYDALQLVTAGVADLTGPGAFSGFEELDGSSGNDTFLVSGARLAGVTTIDGGGGTDIIRLAAAGSLDLSGVALTGIARVEGSAGADTLKGSAGDDVLKGAAGDDILIGGPGHDVALYSVASTAATWTANPNGTWTVTTGADGTDTVSGVETLRFTDKDIALPQTVQANSDFNLDGKSDVLWRNDSGEIYVWNSQSGQGAFLGQTLGNPGMGWHVQDVADYNGDGKADILWRNNAGDLYVYKSDPGGAVTFTGQSISYVNPVWQVVQQGGDFNGDGRADILFRNADTGEVYVWNSQTGSAAVNFLGQSLGMAGNEWQIKAVGDFNGDDRPDILWRSAAGDVYVWLDSPTGAPSMTGQSISSVPNDWSIIGTGDFNGDGRDDILWRHAGDGELYVWNSQLGSNAVNFVGQSLGVVGLDWSVAAIGDYDGDGRADILFRNTDGRVYVWNSNDTGAVGFTGQGLGTTPTDWHILSDFHGM